MSWDICLCTSAAAYAPPTAVPAPDAGEASETTP